MFPYSSGAPLPCVRSQYTVNLDVHLQPCVWPGAPCGQHGICRENNRGRLYFTACSCLDGTFVALCLKCGSVQPSWLDWIQLDLLLFFDYWYYVCNHYIYHLSSSIIYHHLFSPRCHCCPFLTQSPRPARLPGLGLQ